MSIFSLLLSLLLICASCLSQTCTEDQRIIDPVALLPGLNTLRFENSIGARIVLEHNFASTGFVVSLKSDNVAGYDASISQVANTGVTTITLKSGANTEDVGSGVAPLASFLLGSFTLILLIFGPSSRLPVSLFVVALAACLFCQTTVAQSTCPLIVHVVINVNLVAVDFAGSTSNGEFVHLYGTYENVYTEDALPAACAPYALPTYPLLLPITQVGNEWKWNGQYAIGWGDTAVSANVVNSYFGTQARQLNYNQRGIANITLWVGSRMRVPVTMELESATCHFAYGCKSGDCLDDYIPSDWCSKWQLLPPSTECADLGTATDPAHAFKCSSRCNAASPAVCTACTSDIYSECAPDGRCSIYRSECFDRSTQGECSTGCCVWCNSTSACLPYSGSGLCEANNCADPVCTFFCASPAGSTVPYFLLTLAALMCIGFKP